MKKENLVSIIIPVYNSEKTISRAINSLQSQTHNNLEIIVVSDGSTDGTVNIVKELASADSRIILVQQENFGPYKARYNGIKRANGDYLMFLDSDDFFTNEAIESLLTIAINNNSDLVKFRFQENNNGKIECEQDNYLSDEAEIVVEKEKFKDLVYPLFFETYMMNSMCTSFIKKSCIPKDNDNLNIALGEDMLFSMNLIENINNITFVNKVFYNYCDNEESLIRTKDTQKVLKNLKDGIYTYYEFYKYAKKWEYLKEDTSELEIKIVYILSTLISKLDLTKEVKLQVKEILNDNKYKEVQNNINIKEIDPNMKNYDLIISLISGSFFEHKN